MPLVNDHNASSIEPITPTVAVAARVQSMSQLLAAVEESTHSRERVEQHPSSPFEIRLAESRLGIATSLFLALRAKHAPTAAHSLRVAVLSSAWLEVLKAPTELRDEIEVAALLHDVGKVGVPDQILMKPGKLTAEEHLYMDFARKQTLEIAAGCCNSPQFMETLRYMGVWFLSRQATTEKQGIELPYGSRLLSIVDAFDSMTTHSMYRPAMSRERAVAELFEKAGSQFDPQLVHEFSHFVTFENSQLEVATARRWLGELSRGLGESLWQLGKVEPTEVTVTLETNFHEHLLESLGDAVIYLDASAKITRWNRAAEKLTGVAADAVLHHYWSPALIGLANQNGMPVAPEQCPVLRSMCRGERQVVRLQIKRPDGNFSQIDALLTPVLSRTQAILGISCVFHDVSNQLSLEQRVQNLHERATRDPLTGLTNRAEFDRLFEQFIKEHLASGRPCSLIITDIDFFKKINDNYGHPVGDEALKAFASLMRKHCRAGDVVARYGGEEFLLFCADCNNATAAKRADQIRLELAGTAQPMIANNCMTASFGVTELQNGDDADAMLARADRALLQAKDNGRNQVVQLGVGFVETKKPEATGLFNSMLHWFQSSDAENLVEQTLITSVPLNITVEKLRGFIADHQADILSINSDHITLQMDGDKVPLTRRSTDRCVPYVIDVRFTEQAASSDPKRHPQTGTLLRVLIRPKRGRDRRQASVQERARQLYASLKSYLVARELEG